MLNALLASFWLPQAASRNAAAHDALFNFIMGVTIFFSTLIIVMLVYFAVRYRHREGQPHDPTGGHSTALELTWTIIPTLLVLVIFYFGFRGYLHANEMPPFADHVIATGMTWKWSFTYENGLTDDELHLVIGKPTEMELRSADVIHDLDIPVFRMKKDAVPGRYNKEWFEPNVLTPPAKPVISWKPGMALPSEIPSSGGNYGLYKDNERFPGPTPDVAPGEAIGFENHDGQPCAFYTVSGRRFYYQLDLTVPGYTWKSREYYPIYCAMYCGTGHSVMLARCFVESQAEHDAWIQNKTVWEPNMCYVDRGKQLYGQRGCNGCHSIDGSRMTGPTWKDMYGSMVELESGPSVLADEPYIDESIRIPSAKIVKTFTNAMPANYGDMAPNDVAALTWFMKSVSANYKGDMTTGLKVGAAVAGMKGGAPAPATPAPNTATSAPSTEPAAQPTGATTAPRATTEATAPAAPATPAAGDSPAK